MTIAEARRLLKCRSNYALARMIAVSESTVSRWKRRNGMVPVQYRDEIKQEARK